VSPPRGLSARIAAAPGDWIALDPAEPEALVRAQQVLERQRLGIPDRAAAVEAEPGGPRLWRRDYLLALLRAGLVAETDAGATLAEVAARKPFVFGPAARRSARRGRALLISAFGRRKFGGVEHFLEQMAGLYAGLGYEPLIVGTRPDAAPAADGGGLDVPGHPDALLRLAVEQDATLVHVVSGLGYEVAAALRYLDLRLIFGVHFWRELFHPRTASPGYYPHCPEGHAPRPTFPLLLADNDAVYVNSDYAREVVERQFGAHLPVIPSLPDDLLPEAVADAPSHAERDCVLLVNARDDKGFGMLLAVATLLPRLRFVALAGQSAAAAARAAACRRGLANVEVLPHAPDMAALYRRARAVMVPSYRFVETFSRVVVEAQRHGVPVLGSDRGNVPLLLRESGRALPEEPTAWAAELDRLWHDPAHWQAASSAARRAAARLPFADQAGRLARLVAGLEAPMLVGVGSGLGNILHTTPLIRRLAAQAGAPVDVVVAGDWTGSLAVLAEPASVRHVFELSDVALRRPYDTVFLTHSFGRLVPAFRARRVVASRSWQEFSAAHPLHEAEFNLAAARHLLGLEYGPEDVRQGFFGALRYRIPASRLIGLHAGSKQGVWASKRWPHYAALAEALAAEGWQVASFGTPDEHVEGTLDLTGGTIAEMAERMLGCRAFVANDSGVMNVANTLGIPLVALFGPTAPATRAPLGPNSISLAVEADCAPCEVKDGGRAFQAGTCRCIAGIGLDAVRGALAALLARTGPAG
jgi:ADP-heptose:LPS heptosyltransferase/glycosyltransferase involved in cell wall biosynthesis